jgi:hypothetical protein
MRHGDMALNGGFSYLAKINLIKENKCGVGTTIIDDLLEFVTKINNIRYYLAHDFISTQVSRVCKALLIDKDMQKEWGEYFGSMPDLTHGEISETFYLEKKKSKLRRTFHKSKLIDNVEELEKVRKRLDDHKKKEGYRYQLLLNKEKFLADKISQGVIK